MVTSLDFPAVRWHGRWIWTPDDAPLLVLEASGENHTKRRSVTVLFRRTVHLDSVPERVPTRLTADSRYVHYVNGREMSRGPVRSQPRRMMYDMVDLAPALQSGTNTIAVVVKYYGRGNAFYMLPVPNTGLGKSGVLVFEADLGAAGWLISDDSLQSLFCRAWDFQATESTNAIEMGVPVEVLDARTLLLGWTDAGFAASDWKPAHVMRAVQFGGYARSQPPTYSYGLLFPRTIAALAGETVTPTLISTQTLLAAPDGSISMPTPRIVQSMKLAASEPATAALPHTVAHTAAGERILFNFGRIVAGSIQLTVQAPAGTVFDLAYTEDRLTGDESGPMAPAAGSRYIARGASDTFETFDVNGLRFVYLLIHGADGPVTISHLAVGERLYPWTKAASFASSDPNIDRLFHAAVRTVALNSHDAFLGCPTCEQRAWVGDSVVHQMVHLATNPDWRLAWQYLFLGASPRYDGILPMSVGGDFEAAGGYTIPEWSLHCVHGVFNLHRFSGDAERVKEYMPVVERILCWYAPYQIKGSPNDDRNDGLLKDVPEWCLMDWGAQFLEDVSSIHSAIWARGLKEFAEMAGWLQEKASQRWALKLYAEAERGFEQFWDPTRDVYVDHIKDGVRRQAVSQIAGALAIVSGRVPRERWARIMDALTDTSRLVVRTRTGGSDGGYSIPKIMMQFQGIYEADWYVEHEITIAQPFMSYVVHDALAAAGMADRIPDLALRWNEFLQDGYDTFGECWGWGTHVHGWSGTLARDFMFYTLGVTPDAPGYARAHRTAPRPPVLGEGQSTHSPWVHPRRHQLLYRQNRLTRSFRPGPSRRGHPPVRSRQVQVVDDQRLTIHGPRRTHPVMDACRVTLRNLPHAETP